MKRGDTRIESRKERNLKFIDEAAKRINGEGIFHLQKIRSIIENRDSDYSEMDFMVIKYKNGQEQSINLRVLSEDTILKLVDELNQVETDLSWNVIKEFKQEQYTEFVNFARMDFNNILSVDVREGYNSLNSNYGTTNFIPLVLDDKYQWMSPLWEQMQITCSIEGKEDKERDRIMRIRRIPCLYYAIEQTEPKFNMYELQKYVSYVAGGAGAKPKRVNDILKDKYNRCLNTSRMRISKRDDKFVCSINNHKEKGNNPLNLCIIKFKLDNHYCTGKKFSYNKDVWNSLSKYVNWWTFDYDNTGRKVNATFLIKEGIEKGILKPMTNKERQIILCDKDAVQVDGINDQIIKYHSKPVGNYVERKNDSKYLFFADTEAICGVDGHIPFCICWYCINLENDKEDKGSFYGTDCIRDFINLLSTYEGKKLVYFHNLKYDLSFFYKYMYIISQLKEGTRVYQLKAVFTKEEYTTYKSNLRNRRKNDEKNVVEFKDTYLMINMPLSKFAEAFKLGDDGIKEIYPYNYMTHYTIYVGYVNNCWSQEKPKWSKDKIDQFKKNIEPYMIGPDKWDVRGYTLFYCNRDVDILRKGFMSFRNMCKEQFNVDPLNYMTISALSNDVFMREAYSPIISNLYYVHGPLNEFIKRSIYGGRCMTRLNEMYHIIGDIVDYDACSLYPSAMKRLLLPTGEPKLMIHPTKWYLEHLMDEDQIEPTEDKFISYFIVEIDITKIEKHLDFPLISYKDKEGIRVYDDINIQLPLRCVYNSIQLQDLLRYQGIDFDDVFNDKLPVKGIYWDGVKTSLLSSFITKVYEARCQLKREKNPAEQVYKLIMNSAYGKTIQKDITVEEKFFDNDKDAEASFVTNYASTLRKFIINDHCVKITRQVPVDDLAKRNWKLSYIGSLILAMSKRIMNEVFDAADKADVTIYYQDTDSIHIAKDDLPLLEESYMKIYSKVLRGSNMGNFHTDFPTMYKKEEVCAIESIILGKKAYFDLLKHEEIDDEENVINTSLSCLSRLKGISQYAIEGESEQFGSIHDLYLYLFNQDKNKIAFDLAIYGPQFSFKNMETVSSIENFIRTVSFEGKRNFINLLEHS